MDWFGNKFRNSISHMIFLITKSKQIKNCIWRQFGYVKMKRSAAFSKANTKTKKKWKIKNRNKIKFKAGLKYNHMKIL